ncbi:MAG: YbaK/EbsC family protein [Usitatibacteraceae bacterium]
MTQINRLKMDKSLSATNEIHAHPGVTRVREALLRHGLDDSIAAMPAATHTAQAAADALGCTIGEIAKSIIFRAGERAVLVITSGKNRVDERKVAALTGLVLTKADADFVRAQTGFVIGGVPPMAHTCPPVVLMDEDLLAYARVWPAAGHPNTVFHIDPRRLADVTGAQVANVALIRSASST